MFGECNPQYENRHHLGLDSKPRLTPTGTPVFAAAAGIVRYSTQGSLGGYGSWVRDADGEGGHWSRGYAVVLEHHLASPRIPSEEWVTTLYGHVQSGEYNEKLQIGLIPAGAEVRKGQYIARVADFVAPSGTNWHHLHFGVRLGRYDLEGGRQTHGYGPVCNSKDVDAPWDTDRWTDPARFLDSYSREEVYLGVNDWPMFLGEGFRRGHSAAPALRDPVIRWSQKVGIQGWLNNPVILGERIFVGSSGWIYNAPDKADGVYCLDLATGKVLWLHPVTGDVNGVACHDRWVIATADDGSVRALDRASGQPIWIQTLSGGKVYTNPLLTDSLVVVGDAAGRVHGLDLKSGERLWHAQLDGPIRGGASTDGSLIFAASQGGDVAAYTSDGREMWKTKIRYRFRPQDPPRDAQVYSIPVVAGDRVLVGFARRTSGYDVAFMALNRTDGTVVWPTSPTPDAWPAPQTQWANIRSTPAVVGDLLFHAEAYSNRVEAHRLVDGQRVWAVEAGTCLFPHWPSPAVAGRILVIPKHDGGVYGLDVVTGEVRWSLYLGLAAKAGPIFPKDQLPRDAQDCSWNTRIGKPILASPAIAKTGEVVVGTEEGYLFCIGERGR